VQILQTGKRYHHLYTKIAGVLLLVGGVQFMLGVVIGESQYPGYSTSKNTLSDMSGSCPTIDPANPLQCINSVILQPSATIFSSIVFIIGLTAAVSAYFIHKTLGGRIAPALLFVTGVAAMGVGIFPGSAGVAHGYFAMTTFYSGGLAAIASYRILKESKPMQYLSVALGSIGIVILMSLVTFVGSNSPFISTFGVGGAERLVAYPVVFWLISLGGYLIAASSLVVTSSSPKGMIQR
jgi:hypothetical membrane protein